MNTFGMIMLSMSTMESVNRQHSKIKFLSARKLKSNFHRQSVVITAIKSSARKYLDGIFALQYLHFPRRKSHEKRGNKSKTPSTWPQFMQWLLPFTTDSLLTILTATQFRNDPKTAPRINATTRLYTNTYVDEKIVIGIDL